MINSAGQQDLIVYVLGRNQRYRAANYPNVAIPTNLEVVNDVRNDFGGFYKAGRADARGESGCHRHRVLLAGVEV